MILTFIQENIDILLYLKQLKSFININYLNYILLLNKVLYGLK